MNTKHEYKGFTISKRSGRTHRTRSAVSGYAIWVGADRITFNTLRDAKAWVDANVAQ